MSKRDIPLEFGISGHFDTFHEWNIAIVKKYKLKRCRATQLILIFWLGTGSFSGYALDTNEPLNLGLTDFESYVTLAPPSGSNVQLVVGAGLNDFFNLYTSFTRGQNQSRILSLMNIATISEEVVEFDLFVGVQTEFQSLSVPMGVEVSKSFGTFVLYSQPLITASLSNSSSSSFLPIGVYISPVNKLQLFFQGDYSTGGQSGLGVAIGGNLLMNQFELITEFGNRFGWYVTVGLIFTAF